MNLENSYSEFLLVGILVSYLASTSSGHTLPAIAPLRTGTPRPSLALSLIAALRRRTHALAHPLGRSSRAARLCRPAPAAAPASGTFRNTSGAGSRRSSPPIPPRAHDRHHHHATHLFSKRYRPARAPRPTLRL